MEKALSIPLMTEQDRRISEVIAEERPRLRNFIRKRVANDADVEDLLQEVFCELVEAHRLLTPIDYVTGWLFRVARNRITDLFRKKKPENFTDAAMEDEEGELLQLEDMSAACFSMSWNWRWANCPPSSAKYLWHTSWRGTALKSCRQRAASTSTHSCRASAMRCSICASACRAFTMSS
jgi:RNA polymerase sigma factor (sigma-70 family)